MFETETIGAFLVRKSKCEGETMGLLLPSPPNTTTHLLSISTAYRITESVY